MLQHYTYSWIKTVKNRKQFLPSISQKIRSNKKILRKKYIIDSMWIAFKSHVSNPKHRLRKEITSL